MHKKKKSVWKKILWLIRPYLHFLMLSFVFAGISALLTLYAQKGNRWLHLWWKRKCGF